MIESGGQNSDQTAMANSGRTNNGHCRTVAGSNNGRTNDNGPRHDRTKGPTVGHRTEPTAGGWQWRQPTKRRRWTIYRTKTVTDIQHAGRRTTNKSSPLIIRSKEEELSRKKRKKMMIITTTRERQEGVIEEKN